MLNEIVDLFPRIRVEDLIHVEYTVRGWKGERRSSHNHHLFPTHLENSGKFEKGMSSLRRRELGILAGGESKVLKRRDFPECGDKKKQILDRFYPVAYTRNGKPFYVKPTTVYFRFSLSPFPDEKTVERRATTNVQVLGGEPAPRRVQQTY